jgi:predicted regulator of Ras-like GTPase activity (Roadblock/LC7/MglB family)
VEQLLANINAVAGVRGSFVCDADGALVARALPSQFDETTLLPAARTMLQTIDGLETTRRRRIHEVDIVFHDSRMVVKNLRFGCLYVICARNINVPLLNLTANVAARKITDMLKVPLPEAPGQAAVAVEEEPAVSEVAAPVDAASHLLASARDLIGAAQRQGVQLRLLGGMAVKATCESAASITLPPERLDLDLAAYGRQRGQLDEIMEDLGYEPYRRFNALHGQRRLKYSQREEGIELDVFVDTFHMCHRLPFVNRLELTDLTIPLADLLLSKLQIVQLDEKDLRDIYAIMCDHELGHVGDVDKVDADYVVSICGDDWGWYKTVSINLEKSIDLVGDFLSESEKEVFTSRARRLLEIIEASPKSLRWQARARVGEARRWYDLPEE